MPVALILILILFASAGNAQPVATGAVNSASFARSDLPNGSLAQGSIFSVFGSSMGPAALAQSTSFPLPTELAGTSVQVTVAGTTVDCIMLFTVAGQLAVILPSNTPLGDGTLTVTFNGQTSAPLPITVVAHSFGIFALNQAGSGPGVFTDLAFSPRTVLDSATPGEQLDVWGTGLGAVAGDEAGGALPGDLRGVDVQVLVGGIPATIIYRGRSGCCGGLDIVRFATPENVDGCYVPVVVVVEGVASNFTTLPVSQSGGTCSSGSGGFTAAELETARAGGGLKLGNVSLSRFSLSFSGPFPAQTFEFKTDTASGSFFDFNLNQLVQSQGVAGISTIGACTVFQIQGTEVQQSLDPVRPAGLDAGSSLTLAGPMGTKQIARIDVGVYSATLSSSLPSFLTAGPKALAAEAVNQGLPSGYLEPGTYTVSGPGGSDVGPFTTSLVVPEALNWTNRDAITSVPRSSNLSVTWAGGGQSGTVQIFGSSVVGVDETASGAAFFCREDVSAGSFSVPSAVLSSLPVSGMQDGIPFGVLGVGVASDGTRFSASGLDLGILSHTDLTLKPVGFE